MDMYFTCWHLQLATKLSFPIGVLCVIVLSAMVLLKLFLPSKRVA